MSTLIDWRRDYPPTLKAEHLASLYPFTLLTIKKMAQQRNPKVPTPCGTRPWSWNRDDVRRHFERRAA